MESDQHEIREDRMILGEINCEDRKLMELAQDCVMVVFGTGGFQPSSFNINKLVC